MVINNPNWQSQSKFIPREYKLDTILATQDISLHTDDNKTFTQKVSFRKEIPAIDYNLNADMFSVRYCIDNNIPLQPITKFTENSDDPQIMINNMQNLSNQLQSLTNK